jgi:hypothetical protein
MFLTCADEVPAGRELCRQVASPRKTVYRKLYRWRLGARDGQFYIVIIVSYILSVLSVISAAAYLRRKFRGRLTAGSILVICLLVFYGPATLVYLLYYNSESVIYRTLMESPYFGESIICLNISIAIAFAFCILGIEFCERVAPGLSRKLSEAEDWTGKPLVRGTESLFWLLLGSNVILATFMTGVSIHEDHLGTIRGFVQTAGSQAARDAYRLSFAGSKLYAYRVVLESIAPFILVWSLIEFNARRAYLALLAPLWLCLAIFVGRLDTLSRAPVAFFILQLAFALMLLWHNRLSWRVVTIGSIAVLAVFYPLIALTIPESVRDGTVFSFFFRRTFAISNETLLEYFTAFPRYLSYTFGANIRPVALLTGQEFRPAYVDVSYLWHGQRGSTSNAMFIADAWAAFSFIGVATASALVATICRTVDLIIVSRGKTAKNVAVLSAVLMAALRLMFDSASTALVSGGLLIIPLIALSMSALATLMDGEHTDAMVVNRLT